MLFALRWSGCPSLPVGWVDCPTYIDEGDGLSNVALDAHEHLFIHLPDYEDFAAR